MDEPAGLLHQLRRAPGRADRGAAHVHLALRPVCRRSWRHRGGQVFIGIQNEREWAVLCRKVLGRPELISDERFGTNPDRVAHDRELTVIIEEALAGIGPGQAIALLDEAGIACARLRTPQEFAGHPQLAARDRWREVDTPGGPVRAMLPPVTVPGREAAMGAVPAVGEHSAVIRAELGLPPDPERGF